jgi:hypothetical protein
VGVELNPGPPLSEEDRWRVVFWSKDNHLTPQQIRTKMKDERKQKISFKAIRKILEKYDETQSVHDKPKSGRKRKLSEADVKAVLKEVKKRKTSPQIAQKLKKKASVRTIQRTIKKEGKSWMRIRKIEKLTEAQKEKRVEYANEMKGYEWKNVLFSDEKTFWLGASPDYAWQDPNDRIEEEVSTYVPKLNVWGAVGYHVKSKLYFFEENLVGELYREILNERLPEKHLTYSPTCPKKLRKKWIFLQDNDPKHKAKNRWNCCVN